MADKRELIEPNEGDKRFVRRDEEGKFKESDDVGRSLSQDQKRQAKTESESGQGDRGDRNPRSTGGNAQNTQGSQQGLEQGGGGEENFGTSGQGNR
ncbi:MAG TPA: hypothetical protein VFS56_12155 [Gemmatimonadaceae bacterium]|nr:hypothetical protein [Gemmatimonadaceae bacterium]